MLDSNDREQAVANWIYSLPCHVNLPAEICARISSERGRLRPCRTTCGVASASTAAARAIARRWSCAKTCPAFPRETGWQSVYTTNISKSGCGFFHSQLLYPGERFTLDVSQRNSTGGRGRLVPPHRCELLCRRHPVLRRRRRLRESGIERMPPTEQNVDDELDGLLDRLVSLAEDPSLIDRSKWAAESPAAHATSEVRRLDSADRGEEISISQEQGFPGSESDTTKSNRFFPNAPRTLAETHISESDVETIVLRYLMLRGSTKGVEIAQQIGLQFGVVEKIFHGLKAQALRGAQECRQSDRLCVRNHGSRRQPHPIIMPPIAATAAPCPFRCRITKPASPRNRSANCSRRSKTCNEPSAI